MSGVILYGIPNCNSVKKAIDFLKQEDISYVFYDFKKRGVTKELLYKWGKQFGLQNMINTNGTTWQKLTEAEKKSIHNDDTAIELMIQNTSLIKRPILEWKKKLLIRFDKEAYSKMLSET